MNTYDPRWAAGQPPDPVPQKPPSPSVDADRSTTSNRRLPEVPHGSSKPRCTARSKHSGERCKCYPVIGSTVCRMHGGAAGQVKVAASRRLQSQAVEAEVQNALAFESLAGVENPLEALSMLAAEALAMKEALAARVNSLNSLRYSAPGSGVEQLRAEVQLYERALDRSAKFLDLLVKSGFDEKRIALTQASVFLASRFLDRVFDGLDLSDRQRALISVVVPAEARRMGLETRGHDERS